MGVVGVNWSEPVGESDSGDWALAVVPAWEAAVELADGWRYGDSLAEQAWRDAVAILDTVPEPATPAAANARWRTFVDALWSLRHATMRRRQAQHRALLARTKRG